MPPSAIEWSANHTTEDLHYGLTTDCIIWHDEIYYN